MRRTPLRSRTRMELNALVATCLLSVCAVISWSFAELRLPTSPEPLYSRPDSLAPSRGPPCILDSCVCVLARLQALTMVALGGAVFGEPADESGEPWTSKRPRNALQLCSQPQACACAQGRGLGALRTVLIDQCFDRCPAKFAAEKRCTRVQGTFLNPSSPMMDGGGLMRNAAPGAVRSARANGLVERRGPNARSEPSESRRGSPHRGAKRQRAHACTDMTRRTFYALFFSPWVLLAGPFPKHLSSTLNP